MYYGVARLEFLVPQSQSLKEKRAVVHRLKDRLEGRLHLAVCEVDYQDLWQRSALGIALVAASVSSARNGLEAARREVEQEMRISLLAFEIEVARFGDPSSVRPAKDDDPASDDGGEGEWR